VKIHDWGSLSSAIGTSLTLTDSITNTRRTNPPAELVKLAKKLSAENLPFDTAIALMKFIHSK